MSWVAPASNTGTLQNGNGPLNVPYPGSISAGDILFTACAWDSAGGGSFSLGDAGFQSIRNGVTGATTQLFWKIATGSESGTFTCDLGGAFIYAQCARFTGGPGSLTGAVDNSNDGGVGSEGAVDWSALTVGTANCLVIAVGAGFFGSGCFSGFDNPSPWTALIGSGFTGFDVFGWSYTIQTAAANISGGSWSPSVTGTGNTGNVIASLKAGVAPGTIVRRLRKSRIVVPITLKRGG